jgi:predicted metal-binding protein
MADRQALEALFRERGYDDFTWIDAGSIVVADWVRMKCRFGCDGYGNHVCCPPNLPPVEECRRFFGDYATAVVFRFEKRFDDPEDRHDWGRPVYEGLMELEREVFVAGNVKTFVLPLSNCRLCDSCSSSRDLCPHPMTARPTAEGLAVDVFSTVRNNGLPIDVLSDYGQPMNRYAFLLVE